MDKLFRFLEIVFLAVIFMIMETKVSGNGEMIVFCFCFYFANNSIRILNFTLSALTWITSLASSFSLSLLLSLSST